MPDGARGMGMRRQLGRSGGRRGARAAARALAWSGARRRALALVLVARRDLWHAELSSLSPVPAAALALDASLRADSRAGDARTLVVGPGADAEAALQRAEAAGARLDALVDSRRVWPASTASTRLLPSLATQQRRRAACPTPPRCAARSPKRRAAGRCRPRASSPSSPTSSRRVRRRPTRRRRVRGTPVAPHRRRAAGAGADGSWAALLPRCSHRAARRRAHRPPSRRRCAACRRRRWSTSATNSAPVPRLPARGRRAGAARCARRGAAAGALAALVARACWPCASRWSLAVLLTLGGWPLGVPLGILHLVGPAAGGGGGSNYAAVLRPAARDRAPPTTTRWPRCCWPT